MSTHEHHAHRPWLTAAQVTLHCLVGCSIGETLGLLIGVGLGLGVWLTIGLATTLAYLTGFTLGVLPVMRREHTGFLPALKIIWIGEALSIGIMEVAMNLVDYLIGGVQAASIMQPIFWIGLAAAIPAGFLAAWPINWWLLEHNLKACH